MPTSNYVAALQSFEGTDTLSRIQDAIMAACKGLPPQDRSRIRAIKRQPLTVFGTRPSIALFAKEQCGPGDSPEAIAVAYVHAALNNG